MKHLHCRCGHLVAILSPGSKIQPGSTVTCRECAEREKPAWESAPPEFLDKLFGVKR